jgi:uncharacterized protein
MAVTADSRRTHRAAARTGSVLDTIAMVLMIIGGLNWGLVGLFEIDIVATLFGDMSPLSRIIYVLVGLAALYGIITTAKLLRRND